jgi:type I restriction enzyme S subunit
MVAPGLRFKQFKNQWVSNKLEALVDSIQSGKSKDRAEDGKFPLFGSTGAIGMTNTPEYSGIAILIARVGANAGSKYLVDGNYSVTDNTLILRLKSGNDYGFFSNLLEYKKLNKHTFGSGQPLVTGGLLKQLEIKSPDLIEQTKIAKFLTSVDAKISQLTKKHELLTLYKKGVMQKIFNQELRFQDDEGREFPEWKLTIIGEIANKVIAGGTPSTLKKEYWGGNIRWMNSGELNLKLVAEVENRITQAGLENSSTKLIPKNCVLIGLAGQGKTRGTVAMNLVELCTNQSIAAILPNPKTFDSHYLCQNLEARYDELRSLSAGDGGRGGLNLQIIKSMEINLPCLQEQAKIANFLTAIDDKIANVKFQLEAAKEYKQGLLQQMFI